MNREDMANEYESNKYLETYLPIPDYYPSGYYCYYNDELL